ncbi:MAG TPA: low temperature requirement protein A [Acidimicrobiales bacterium]
MSRSRAGMSARDPGEAHRSSTPLELFFDLTFVVAVAAAATGLETGLVEGHASRVLLIYPLMFFAIWWAWMNFTWFASAYDVDDVPYRLAVFVQMTGVLILAVGVTRAMSHEDFALAVLGYVVMRLAMVALWIRAALADPAGRRTAVRYAVGIGVVQIGWSASLGVPLHERAPLFILLAVLELCVPVVAEGAGRTAWHPRHIAERLGLFTIIVLGEALLTTSAGVRAALTQRVALHAILPVVIGGLLIVFGMWWIYFDLPSERIAERVRGDGRISGAFLFGYTHYFIVASVAAAGAGFAVAVHRAAGPSHLTNLEAGFAESVPVAIYVLAVWLVHRPYKTPGWWREVAAPLAVALILGTSVLSSTLLASGVVISVLVALNLAVVRRRGASRSL